MNELIVIIIGISIGYILAIFAERRKQIKILRENNPIINIRGFTGNKEDVTFLPEPDNKILQDIKDQESGLSDFYKTIEKPSNDDK